MWASAVLYLSAIRKVKAIKWLREFLDKIGLSEIQYIFHTIKNRIKNVGIAMNF